MKKATKDMIIGDVLDACPETANVLALAGMHCFGCPSARGETLEEASIIHSVDINKLISDINECMSKCDCNCNCEDK